MSYTYFAFGMTIETELPLPEFLTAVGPAPKRKKVSIRFGDLSTTDASQLRSDTSPFQATFDCPKVAVFHVRDARTVEVFPKLGSDPRVIQLYLIGPIIAYLLYVRGLVLMHGSSVVLGDRSVTFLGDSGAGKSSTALALHRRGWPLLTDDLSAVDVRKGRAEILAAYPRLKVDPVAAAAAGVPNQELSLIHHALEERMFQDVTGFSAEPRQAGPIYILQDGERLSFEALPPSRSVVELLRYSFGVSTFHSPGLRPAYLKRCVRLAGRSRVFLLRRPRCLAELPGLAAAVEEHALEASGAESRATL